jgi:hypothetical protein
MGLERRSERSHVRSLIPSLNQNQYASIVSIVGGMVTRMCFASRGSERRE